MFNIGPSELILVLVLALVIFGPKKLPEMGRAIGTGLREFKKATSDLQNAINIEEVTKEVKTEANPEVIKKEEQTKASV